LVGPQAISVAPLDLLAVRTNVAYNDFKLSISLLLISDISIDLVLIDQQSVGKKSLHLMDTVNAKKRWTNIYGHVSKCLK
jgi:hypothetical protein